MDKSEKLIKDAEVECMPWKAEAEIIRCAKAYINANDAVRRNHCGWLSCPPHDTPEWKEYLILRDAYDKAMAALWMATDVEYGNDEIANAAWEWRYWKVMARKCCHYQKSLLTNHLAGKTMYKLQDAETNLMIMCGLDDYKPSRYYIEKMFPKLKLELEV